MNRSITFGIDGDGLQVLFEDGGVVFCRGWRNGAGSAALALLPVSEQPSSATLDRLAHEYSLKEELDGTWAVRPLELVRDRGRMVLVLDDPGGELLSGLLGVPMDVGSFLRIAVGVAAAVGKAHQRGLVHKDIKPANVLVNGDGKIRLTGFGMASRLPRERQPPDPPEVIAGTLAYMAPEQTGRMNRSIDSRSDLYSLGMTFYEMLTGTLPFTATDPMEWVHCHIARQAAPPSERTSAIPETLSSIVMKLLAKTPEVRYQTASGVEADLRRCLIDWQSHGRIDPFPLGAHDASDRLLIVEQLYGREREIATLLAAFDRVVMQGAPELVLVSGYSGIGKSSVVNELHKVLVPPRALFAAGKFDQYKRDIPYATLAQAFQTLIRQILVKSEAEVDQWRQALTDTLGTHGQLIVNLVPELEFIIGKQPAVPDLPPREAQSRFQLVFRRFIGAFAKREHPLALFLDDLQWLDAATLDLIAHLVRHAEVQDLLLVGAYRDNEVGPAHPLLRTLEEIRKTDARVSEIVLAPLGIDDLGRLAAGALHCDMERARPLAQLVYEKTGGNPFFAIQFLTELAEERLLAFDAAALGWQWDIDRIRAKSYTDNVVDLIAGKLRRLSAPTREALKQLACLGNAAETSTLVLVRGETEEAMHAALLEAVHAGLVVYQERGYKFLHDRIQQAVYSLVPDQDRADTHLRIGRVLLAHTPPDEREEIIFEIVGQFNRSSGLITSPDERERVAQLNLLAGKRSRNAAAYSSALTYFAEGRALLAEDCWKRQYPLTFELEFHHAECEFLTGELASAEERLSTLARCAANLVDQATVASLCSDLHIVLARPDRAVEVGIEYLRKAGLELSPHPTDEDVQREYERLWRRLGTRAIEDLIDLPPMNDDGKRATMGVLTNLVTSAVYTDRKLHRILVAHMVDLSLEYGNTDASCYGFVQLGMVLVADYQDYPAALRFGQLSLDLVDKRGLDVFKARVYMTFGYCISPWSQQFRFAREFMLRASAEANKVGDLTFAGYCRNHFVSYSLASGEPLEEVEQEAADGLAFALKTGFGVVVNSLLSQLYLIRSLRGLPGNFKSFDNSEFDESKFARHLEADPNLVLSAYRHWIRKLQTCFFLEDYSSALQAAVKAQALLWTAPAFFERAEYHFYAALARAGAVDIGDGVRPDQKIAHLEALAAHHWQIQIWAEHCPENFENRAALVGAELARLEGRDLDAGHLYEHAIRSARANGFVHNEALACEAAARFYAARSFEDIAEMYLRRARAGYLRWGADGKVRQLEVRHPQLVAQEEQRPGAIIGSPVQQFDVASVVKASQAVSGEIELPKLIEQLMTIALENAGADRGVLILPARDEYLIQAAARATGNRVELSMCQEPITRSTCPESVVRYVIRTRKSVILDDASKPSLFSADDYLRDRQSKSILCLPLIKQRELAGILLLENTLASHAFSAARIAVLELLAAQAAISLENTRLYSDLQERESKVRRLVDSNIIGILIGRPDGHIQEANQAFLRIVGYDQADLAAGRLRRTELTPVEWHGRDARAAAEMRAMGTAQPYEKEYIRKDGSRVPVLIGGATLDERGDAVVIFAVDLTEQKLAEAELAHANRVSTMGQLTASIAHEINQPLAALRTNAETAVRWLARQPPDLEKTREAIKRIINDGIRAADIVSRIRDFSKKAPLQKEHLEVNEVILNAMGLARAVMSEHGILATTRLSVSLPPILGDKVQLQQVILNLIMNAIEAMSEVREGSRELLISSEIETGRVRIAVSDSGSGLPPAKFARIFEAFYTTKPTGLGIGLSICRSIVEAHGGRLWAVPNKSLGAMFCFTLPIGEKTRVP